MWGVVRVWVRFFRDWDWSFWSFWGLLGVWRLKFRVRGEFYLLDCVGLFSLFVDCIFAQLPINPYKSALIR